MGSLTVVLGRDVVEQAVTVVAGMTRNIEQIKNKVRVENNSVVESESSLSFMSKTSSGAGGELRHFRRKFHKMNHQNIHGNAQL
jgi:hypothetical protein